MSISPRSLDLKNCKIGKIIKIGHISNIFYSYPAQSEQTKKPKVVGSRNDFYKKVAYGSIRFLSIVSGALCKNFIRFSFRATVCPENHFLTLQARRGRWSKRNNGRRLANFGPNRDLFGSTTIRIQFATHLWQLQEAQSNLWGQNSNARSADLPIQHFRECKASGNAKHHT